MKMPDETEAAVMAVFSGTEVDRAVFERAIELAQAKGARLVLADVRHQHHAERLAETLSSQAFLGTAAIEELKRSVKAQRDDVIQRALAGMLEIAQAAGVTTGIREAKGPLRDSVERLATEVGARTVVVDEELVAQLGGDYHLVGVR